MFWALIAAFFMVSIRLVRDEMKPILFKQRDPVIAQFKYQYEAQKHELKEEYEKADMPESGYMLTEDYELLSLGIPRLQLKIPEAEPIRDSNMKYVPQPTYKIVRYNNPPGSPELNVPRKLNFDRQINAQGIVSGDFTMMVYPSVYYYADFNCTACSVFVIPLDTNLTKIERIKKANVAKKIDKPIFETDKDTSVEGAFRTITPVDFSEDNRYIIAKEKIGWAHEGIWKTNLWVHDFQADRSWELPEVRSAIVNYWQNVTGVDFDEQRWDIYPLGFDKNNQERILVCAYAYTGDKPSFLGTWAVDVNGEKCELVDLEGTNHNVSTVGFKLVFDSHAPRDLVEFDGERLKKVEKKRARLEKRQLRYKQRAHKKVYREKRKMLKREYRFKLKEYKRSKKRGLTSQGGDEPINVNPDTIDNSQDIDYEKFNKERNEQIKKQQEELLEKQKKAKKGAKDKKVKQKKEEQPKQEVNNGVNNEKNNTVNEEPNKEIKETPQESPQEKVNENTDEKTNENQNDDTKKE